MPSTRKRAKYPRWYTRPQTVLDRRFRAFHRSNPHIYAEIKRRATALRNAGAGRISIAAIIESIRYDVAIGTLSDGYKLDNSFRSRYTRLLLHRHPSFASVIEMRRLRSVA